MNNIIVKHIPNTITSMNLLCGVLGVIASLNGRLELGFELMILAAVFDFCDGLAARLLNAYSEIGKELDSLADDVSFGVLPAVMLYQISGTDIWILKYLPLVLAAFSALRLAKFNLDERQHDSFIGLPTPAAAMICGSLATLVTVRPDCFLAHWCQGPVFIPVLTLILCYLLICEIPMFSMKFGGGKKASKLEVAKRIAFLVIVGLAVIIALVERSHWSFIFLTSFLGYILINLAMSDLVAKK
ncbi:MAG: CDP-diacylglycerol--serine O-phosphatidyltransferase [Bacteroidales bacterium]|uniref:CDP-diacylglycerol--serine O-phosphatidyltransferase n=1 Tax=Candidatus Cryptobacteroides bacterium TaxID=3085639 RepID=UPI002EC051F7|nr:CDP-diacylglycerol--serine O-phosphatidyltransferase [Bacteroidales bacterium]